MQLNWQDLGHIAPGGAVLKIDKDQNDHFWLASPAGLFSQNGKSWHAVMRGIPFWRVNTVLAVESSVWVAGHPHGLVRSTNSGRSWANCRIDQSNAPILTLVASPRFSQDRILVAGTDGDGILRSTDGGRSWKLSNFGLREFAVLDLAVAPAWDRREPLFAVTESGVYVSPNAGRAWKRSDLPDGIGRPSAVAVSPDFASDKTIYVGCEDGTLLVSADIGRTYQVYRTGTQLPPINALQFSASGALIFGTMQGIFQLEPGQTAVTHLGLTDPILSLSQIDSSLFAGLPNGLTVSDDHGRTWHPIEEMSARRFVWYETLSETDWIAAGPEEGLFATTDGGQTWQKVWDYGPILAVGTQGDQTLWVSMQEGLFTSADMGQSWQLFHKPKEPISAIVTTQDILWLGTRSGQILRAEHKKITKHHTPFIGAQPLGLYTIDDQLLAAVWARDRKEMQIWRKADPNAEWQLIFNRPGNPVTPHIQKLTDGEADGLLFGLKTAVYRWTPEGRSGGKITGPASPVTAIASFSSSPQTLVALTDHLVLLSPEGDVTSLETPIDGNGIIALHPIPNSNQLCVGLVDGRVWVATVAQVTPA